MTRWKSILLVLLAVFPLAATTLEQLSLDQMVQRSTAIVRGKVLDSSSRLFGRVICTVYRVQVTENLKGTSPTVVEVAVPGGTHQGLRLTMPGTPKPVAGVEYVFFLWQGTTGTNVILGLSQGLFDIVKGTNGQTVLVRGATGADFVDSQGHTVEDNGMQVTLRELTQKLGAK